MSFEDLGIDEDFNPVYAEMGIKGPNEVQRKVIPQIISGKNIICLAQTGSGKTLAYALPICERIKCHEDEHGPMQEKASPMTIIVAPTKELAVQIHGVFKQISHHAKLRVRNIVGGQRNRMTKSLKDQSFEVLIGTPNKIFQLVKSKDISFKNLQSMVFDEADTLFDMGFKKDIQGILRSVNYSETKISFFSATLPNSVEEFLNTTFAKLDLKKITFKSGHKVQAKIETFNIFASLKERMMITSSFIEKTAKGRGIIFANQKNQVDEIAEYLTIATPKLKFKKLHGDMLQKDRLASLKSFVEGKAQILVATDVAARGIDIKDLKWVFNWNLPKTAEFYLHRTGRVARAGKTGVVYNIVTSYDSKLISIINDAIKNQSSLNLDLIAKDISEVKKKAKKKADEKEKS